MFQRPGADVRVLLRSRQVQPQQQRLELERGLTRALAANASADRAFVNAERNEAFGHDREPLSIPDANPVLEIGERSDLRAEFSVARETVSMNEAAARRADEIHAPVLQDSVA